jgi:hypothetical protein
VQGNVARRGVQAARSRGCLLRPSTVEMSKARMGVRADGEGRETRQDVEVCGRGGVEEGKRERGRAYACRPSATRRPFGPPVVNVAPEIGCRALLLLKLARGIMLSAPKFILAERWQR